MGKMTKMPFSGTMEQVTDLLEIIHTDVCGPMNVEARGGYHYFLTFTDDLSRYGYIYLMKHKSETFEKCKERTAKMRAKKDWFVKACSYSFHDNNDTRRELQYSLDHIHQYV